MRKAVLLRQVAAEVVFRHLIGVEAASLQAGPSPPSCSNPSRILPTMTSACELVRYSVTMAATGSFSRSSAATAASAQESVNATRTDAASVLPRNNLRSNSSRLGMDTNRGTANGKPVRSIHLRIPDSEAASDQRLQGSSTRGAAVGYPIHCPHEADQVSYGRSYSDYP